MTLPDALPLAAINAEAPKLKTENAELSEKASTQNVMLNDVEKQNSRCVQVAVPTNNDETEVFEKEWVEVDEKADDEELDLRLGGFFDAYVDWDYESDFRLDDDY